MCLLVTSDWELRRFSVILIVSSSVIRVSVLIAPSSNLRFLEDFLLISVRLDVPDVSDGHAVSSPPPPVRQLAVFDVVVFKA